MWVPWIEYRDDDAFLKVVDTPGWWVALQTGSCWLSGHRFVGRLGYRLLQWSSHRGDAASREVLRVLLPPEDALALTVKFD